MSRLTIRVAWVSWWSACVGASLVILFERLAMVAFLPAVPLLVVVLVAWAEHLHELEAEVLNGR